MATITVRNISEETRRALKERAARNDRSMEAEARAILEESVQEQPETLVDALLRIRDETGGVDLELPERSTPRPVDLS